jgi:hypothetical protein
MKSFIYILMQIREKINMKYNNFYIIESDVVYAPDGNHEFSCHRRIWQFYNTGDVFKACRKACQIILKEKDKIVENKEGSAHPDSPYQGLKLYFEYWLNESRKGKKDKVHRCYLLDGKPVSQTVLLERMEQAALFLTDTGNIFRRVEVVDEQGRLFWVCEDGGDPEWIHT